MQVSHLFHPLACVTPPEQLFLKVAYSCYRRSLRLTWGVFPFAPALALLGTPRGPKITLGSELRAWHEAELYTLGDIYEDGRLIQFSRLQESGLPAGQFLLYNSLGERHRAAVRFTDLGLITAKRLITRKWKSTDPPAEQAWKYSFEVWAGAEGVALKREDALGLR
ncbi:hypothetical protein NDU88_002130 [Pleurodeles waltl]|uniref:ATP-dependent DNA ligase family profile domain-containing protein n=1 Tax=Pleurodeles waltl TaxID=8319 RepID=A0AAV7QC19_PLEWA|nr:hypothetical protein NDU88_002130 [Pleurodeles waltl]